jgi:hypothetical protein
MKDPAGNAAPSGGFKVGGWYSGYQYNGTGFSQAAGVSSIGDNAGKDVPAQNAQDAAFIQQQRISANQIQAPINMSLPSSTAQTEYVTGLNAEAENARKAVENEIKTQQSVIDSKSAVLKANEQQTLGEIKTLTTPFRETLENTERDRLKVNENFQANQKLVNELDQLLTEGNDLIRQQQEVTGLAAVRNPRIQKAMDDVAARAGVIQAVISARNGQISVAENMIDRSISAISADRQDQISYYETVLQLNRQDIIRLDDASSKLLSEQLQLKKDDLNNIQKTVDYVKQLMLDPNTAQILADGGVKLTDSVEEINKKVANVTYAREVSQLSNDMVAKGGEAVVSTKGIPKDELAVLTDSRGQKHFYRVPKELKGGTGTEAERSVPKVANVISQNKINFTQAIDLFAGQMSLSDIYSAYAQSEMGQQYGMPTEDPSLIAEAYKIAKLDPVKALDLPQ